VSPLKIKIPVKNLGRQRCAEGFNSGDRGLTFSSVKRFRRFGEIFPSILSADYVSTEILAPIYQTTRLHILNSLFLIFNTLRTSHLTFTLGYLFFFKVTVQISHPYVMTYKTFWFILRKILSKNSRLSNYCIQTYPISKDFSACLTLRVL
jgi:hypothetical protein